MGDFKKTQIKLSEAIKNPALENDFDKRRLGIYQELIFNNLESFCASAMPVLKSVTPQEIWLGWVRGYLVNVKSPSPLFIDIAEQFLQYLTTLPIEDEQPWRNELAHYEWVELNVSLQDSPQKIDGATHIYQVIEEGRPLVVADSAWALAYKYPVHKVSSDNFDFSPEPTFLVVYLDHENEVRFLQTTSAVIVMLNQIEQQNEMSFTQLQQALSELGFQQSPEQLKTFLTEAISDLISRGVLAVT